MKKTKKIFSILLVAVTILTNSVPVHAAENSSKKEEVIYVITNADGSVSDAYAVNIFDGGDIIDYGNYSEVKMLKTDDKITQSGGAVRFSSSADKVYYEGTLQKTEIPWNISIQYYLDSQEYLPEDIAGKSGKLEIKFKITQNEKCNSTFYKNYDLQVVFMFDTDLCSNITTEGATAVNVGKKKQFSYTVLPGKGLDTTISADVKDFEMDAIAINGIKLNLNVEIDDTELTDQLGELTDAISQIDDGTSELKNASIDIVNGVEKVHKNMNSLSNGLSSLNSKGRDIRGAAQKVFSASIANVNLQLTSALGTEIGLTSSNYRTVLNNLIEKCGKDSVSELMFNGIMAKKKSEKGTYCNNSYGDMMLSALIAGGFSDKVSAITMINDYMANDGSLSETYSAFSSSLQAAEHGVRATIKSAMSDPSDKTGIYTAFQNALKASKEAEVSLKKALATLSDLEAFNNAIVQYTDGVSTASSGVKALTDGTEKLYDGVVSFSAGTEKLSDGSSELREKTSDMDERVDDKIQEMLSSIQTGDSKTVSFISEKNTNVTSVQFVIKTPSIEIAEADSTDTLEEPTLTFWQKLLRLFGLY